jgi:hypothetical protein
MGNVYTDNYAAAFNVSPGKLIKSASWGAEKRVYRDIYVAVALAAAEVIYFFKPAKGYRLAGGYAASTDLANNTTLEVGIPTDTAKFMAATNHGAGSAVKTALLAASNIAAEAYEFDGDTCMVVKTGTGIGTGTIHLVAEFECVH